MLKRMIGLGLLTLLAFAAGCGKNRDAEVNAFMSDLDKVTNDLVEKVKAEPSAAGLDEAQKILDAKVADLKGRFDKFKDLREGELTNETMKKFTDGVSKDIKAVANLQVDYVEKTVGDEVFGKKMNKLYTDYNSIFGI